MAVWNVAVAFSKGLPKGDEGFLESWIVPERRGLVLLVDGKTGDGEESEGSVQLVLASELDAFVELLCAVGVESAGIVLLSEEVGID